MSGRIGTRARTLGVATLVGAALLAGCTTDEGIEVVVDDGGDAMATLSDAVARTEELSGEFTIVSHTDMSEQMAAMAEDMPEELRDEAELDDGRWSVEMRGRFDGDDMDAVMTLSGSLGSVFGSDEGQDADGNHESRFVMVGERAYRSALPFDEDGITEALAGRSWIEEELPDPAELAELEAMGHGAGAQVLLGGALPQDVLGSLGDLDQLVDLREAGTVEFDGTEVRSFRAEFSQQALWSEGEVDEFGQELTTEQQARADRIRAYRDERVRSDVEVLVDREGLVRRVEVSTTDDIEPIYRNCMQMYGMGDSSLVIELRALGSPVEITAPEPAQVMPLEEYDALWEQRMADEIGEYAPSDELDDLPELDALEAEGRRWLEQGVIDGADLIGLDTATVPAMSDDELYAAEQRIWEAEAALPRTPTALGEMTRTELFWHVRQGMEREGIDPAMADGMTNEQLAGLIDAYMADPALASKVPEEYRVPAEALDEPEELMDADWMFEGCPG